jgi:single-strand DNA-binding protein
MADFNRVLLIGRLTRNPELRHTPQGAPVCDFSIAINRRFTTRDGQRRDETTFVDIVAWNRTAELCSQFLAKGRTVFVEGRLVEDRWESKTGEKRSKLRVVADSVQFLDPRPRGSEAGASGTEPPEEEPPAPPADDVAQEESPF